MSRSLPRLTALALLIAVCAFPPATALAQTATVKIAALKGPAGGQVDVPITISDPSNMGALHVEVTYDEAVLKATAVEKGSLASNGLVESNLQPGRVVIGVVTSDAITGAGEAVVVKFDVVGEKGAKTALGLENVRAWQGDENRFDIKVVSQSGELTVTGASSFPWWIVIVVAVILVLLLLWWRRSRRRPAPVPQRAAASAPSAPVAAPGIFYVDAPEPLVGSDGNRVGTLQPGVWYNIGRQEGEWVETTDANGVTGWVRAASVRRG